MTTTSHAEFKPQRRSGRMFVNARFPLSCDPLRTPRLAIRSWSWNFSEISGLDTRWCESIRSDTICCARMRSGHDLSISGVTICHGLISRSDTITYVPIGLFRSSPRLGLDLTRSSRSGSPNWDDLVRADTFRYVHHEPMRSVTIGYDCGRDVFHDHDRGWSRFELRLDPDGYIYSPTDHGLHCFLNFYRVNTTTINHWWWQELRMMTTWQLQYLQHISTERGVCLV